MVRNLVSSLSSLKLSPGVNFTNNILRAVFTHADPKSAKKTVKLSRCFVLLGSSHVKAARRMLVKLTPHRILLHAAQKTQICNWYKLGLSENLY